MELYEIINLAKNTYKKLVLMFLLSEFKSAQFNTEIHTSKHLNLEHRAGPCSLERLKIVIYMRVKEECSLPLGQKTREIA